MVGISHNGITVSIERWPGKKLPVLSLHFEGENSVYKVASFNSEQTARWFSEVMEEFFKDVLTKEEHENKEQEDL